MNVLMTRRTLLLLLSLVLATVFLSTRPAPEAAASSVPACSQALDLATAGLPQRAIDLLRAAGEQVVAQCGEAWAQASAQVSTAALEAERAKTAASLGDAVTAKRLAEAALVADRENAQATQTLSELAAEEQKRPTWIESIAKKFENFTKKYVTPARDLLGAMLLVLASLLLAARVAPLLVPRWPVLMGSRARAVVAGGGALSAAAATYLTTIGLAASPSSPELAVAAAVLGVAAVGLLGWWLATRLRVAVDAHKGSDSDAAAAAHIAALLSDLGAAPPRGLEVPSGADTVELGNALASIPGVGSLVTRIGQILAGLLGATPWRIDVAAVEGDALAVRMSRNGHPMGSVVIRPTDGRRPEEGGKVPQEDLQRLAAAFALTVLSENHGPFPGLAGARDWRSLGLHYIATTDLRGLGQIAGQREALARAVDLDPGNQLAELAWQHSKWRTSDGVDELNSYRQWLTAFLDRKGTEALAAVQLRAAYTRTAVILNLRSLQTDLGGPEPVSKEAYTTAYQDLQRRLARFSIGDRARGDLDPLIGQMTDVLKSLPPPSYTQAKPGSFGPPPVTQQTPTTPRGIYNLACWYAGCDPVNPGRAVELLKQVTDVPDYRDWMDKDPQLVDLRKKDDYRNEFGADPRSDFYVLPLVAPHSALLKTFGFGNPSVLAAAARDASSSLYRILPDESRETVAGLALVHENLLATKDLGPAAVEILFELADRGLTNERAMRHYPHAGRLGASTEISGSIIKRCKPSKLMAEGGPPLTAELVRTWWNASYR